MFDYSYIVDWTDCARGHPDKARITKEKNKLFCLQMQVSGKAGFICAVTFAVMVLLLRFETAVFAWMIVMGLVYGGRYMLLGRLMRKHPEKACSDSVMRCVEGTVLVNGIGWGLGAGLFVWPELPVTQLPFLLIMMGMLMICGPLMAAKPRAGLLFSLPLLTGTLVHLHRMDLGAVHFATTSVIVCAIAAFGIVMTFETHRVLMIGIVERLEKEDIVDRLTKARERAEDTARQKSAFLATMSHEIRNPVNGLMGMLEILKETRPTTEQAGYLDVASKSADALLCVLNDILDFSKLEVGKLELEKTAFDWMSLVGETAMMNRVLAAEKGVSFHLLLPDDASPVVRGDPLRLRQILGNFLSNALKFTDEGSITLSVRSADAEDGRQKLSFSVKDTGIGMDEEARKRLFVQYQQGSASTSRKFGGTGLGLAISQQLAHLMGGEITVASEPGCGSEFTLVAYFDKATLSDIPDAGNSGGARFHASVLLVEDDPISQRVAAMMLKGFGLVPAIADNGKAAIQLFSSGNFDLVFVDSRLPDMDGFEVAGIMRARGQTATDETRRSVIVALSGACTPADRKIALDKGIDDFLTKPLRKRDLRQCLERWLGGSTTPATDSGRTI